MKSVVLVAILLFAQVYADCSSSSAGDSSIYPTYYTTAHTGPATYYGAYTNGGACSLDPTPYVGSNSGIYTTVAIADNIWAGSKACGMCISVTAQGSGTPFPSNFIAFVNNECPSCDSSGIDIGLSGDNIWPVSWKAVPCPVGSTKIQFLFQGANSYYIKLQVRNTRYPVKGVSILQGGAYHDLVRTADNFFEAGSSVTYPLAFPLGVKVTSVDGDTITDSIPSLTNGVVIDGTTQFLDCSGSTATTATATTATSTTAKPTTTTTTTTTTAKSTTTTTTTTGGSTTGSQTSTYIFQDALLNGFADWSWGTFGITTAKAHTGTSSYGFTPSAWSAAYFEKAGFQLTKATVIEFYAFGTTNQPLTFALLQSSSPVFTSPLTIPGTSTWTKFSVTLPTGTYDGIWFQDATGGSNPQVYLDDIRFIS